MVSKNFFLTPKSRKNSIPKFSIKTTHTYSEMTLDSHKTGGSHGYMILCPYSIKLRRAPAPNPTMAMPEILFTHRNLAGVKLVRKRLTLPLKTSHHKAEPTNTPNTSIAAGT